MMLMFLLPLVKWGCRLDRFYVTKYIYYNVVVCKNVPFDNTDHDAEYLNLNVTGDITFGSRYWIFNKFFIEREDICNKKITKFFSDLIDGMEILS